MEEARSNTQSIKLRLPIEHRMTIQQLHDGHRLATWAKILEIEHLPVDPNVMSRPQQTARPTFIRYGLNLRHIKRGGRVSPPLDT